MYVCVFEGVCLTLRLTGEGFYGYEVIPLVSRVDVVAMRAGYKAENRLHLVKENAKMLLFSNI